MKVLQINAVNGIRSTGKTTLETSEFLFLNGIDNYIAYSYGLESRNSFKIGNKFDRLIHSFFSRLFGLQGYFSFISTHMLLSYIKKIKPDIIHIRNLHSNYINIKLLFNYIIRNNIATVITLHDCWFYTGKCTHYTLDNCFKWRDKCFDCPRLKKDNVSWLFDRTLKMYNDKKNLLSKISRLAIIGVSDWITNEAKQSFLASSSIITRIYNWVDINQFKPMNVNDLRIEMKLENKFIILGVASSWNNAKGLKTFIELSKVLTEDYQIILIGTLNKKYKLPSNIIHINETHDSNTLMKFYNLADCLLNMSYEETFGKVVAESLSCGTPAIVLNSTASPELIGENCGIVIEKLSISELINSIETIKKNGKIFYSEDCRSFAMENFKMEDRLHETLEVYRELVRL